MRTNSIIYVIIALMALQQIVNSYQKNQMQKQIEGFYDLQKTAAIQKEKEAQITIDSLTKVIERKEIQITAVVNSLKTAVQQSKINNQKYETIKQNIPNLTADSITGSWSKRYER